MAAAGGSARGKGSTTGKGKPRGRQAPVSDETRARIVELHGEGMGRNAIAREVDLNPSTVGRICAGLGLTFDRSATRAAVEARVVDLKAERAELTAGVLADARRIRGLMFEAIKVRTTDGHGVIVEYDTAPTARDWRDAATAIGILIDKHLVLQKFDSDDTDLPAVERWLQDVLGRQ